MLSFDEALDNVLANAVKMSEVEEVETADGLGRVLAKSLTSSINVPPLDNSAMDGYAVRTSDLNLEGSTKLPISQRIPAGSVAEALTIGTAARIFTGAPIPQGADAVIMQENCTPEGNEVVINCQARQGMNIRRAGEDIRTGSEILLAGTKLRPQDLGQAASVGIGKLPVYRKLRVAMFFTGNELVMPGAPLQTGQIYNSNQFSVRGLLQAMGCEITDYGIVPDSLDSTVETLRKASQDADLVITSGGVSVGEEDHVKAAVEQVGEINMWRLAIKPGKPLAFGRAGKAAFIGLPGNPVSAFVTFCMVVRPYILRCQGVTKISPLSYRVRADFDWPRPDKRREFLRAKMEPNESGEPGAILFPHQGSGVLTSTVWGDGLIDLPSGQTIARGDRVRFIPYSE